MEAPAVEAAGRGKAAKSKAKGDSYRPDKLQKALEVAAGVADSVSYKVRPVSRDTCLVLSHLCRPRAAVQ